MRLTLFLILIFAVNIFAQVTPPSGYTKNYKLRMWSQGARPSADSLNQNWKDIDSLIYKVSLETRTDTTDIAYKSRVNNFTNSNTFSKANFNEIVFDNKVIYEVEYYEPPSGTIVALLNEKPVYAFVVGGYSAVNLHGLRYHNSGQTIRIVNLMDININLIHNSNTTPYFPIYTPTRDTLVVPYLGAVELLGIDYGGKKYYLVINKNF